MSTRSGKGGVHPVVLMVDTAPANGKIDIKGQSCSNKVKSINYVLWGLFFRIMPKMISNHPSYIIIILYTAALIFKVVIKLILVYTPLTMEIGKREVEATLPLWLQTEMCYSDADRTILDELRKCAQAQTRKLEIESGIEPLKQSIDQITEQLAVVQEYVTVSFILHMKSHEMSV